MKTFILIMVVGLLFSCEDKKTNQQASLRTSSDYFNKFLLTRNQDALQSSYRTLQENDEFTSKGLTDNNRSLVIQLLMYLKKYDELKNLINEDESIDKYKKELTLNLLEALDRKKSEVSKIYIKRNLSLINAKINENPRDSLLYIDYVTMKLYLNGRDETLNEIDSMMMINSNKFSEDYYELVLRDFVKDYPNEFLW